MEDYELEEILHAFHLRLSAVELRAPVPGPRGPRGFEGKAGDDGEDGDSIPGEPGEQGDPGEPGEPGPEGPPGPRGLQGRAGGRGARGVAGPRGLPGKSGGPGPAGARGLRGVGVPPGGKQGYVLAKRSGRNFDTQWIALARSGSSFAVWAGGQPGPAGADGAPGEDGNANVAFGTGDPVSVGDDGDLYFDISPVTSYSGWVYHDGAWHPFAAGSVEPPDAVPNTTADYWFMMFLGSDTA